MTVRFLFQLQDDRSSVMTEENNETDPVLEEMFAAVVLAKDGSRKISEMFTVLPSKTVSNEDIKDFNLCRKFLHVIEI